MKSLEAQPETRAPLFSAPPARDEGPQPLAPARWDWREVRSVLVVRLRSIGDTVLATPSLRALRRFLPEARIDILLEDWVAPLLEGSRDVDRVIRVARGSAAARIRVARELRAARYDVAFNLHGGSTAALLSRASGARRRVGYRTYAYASLHNHAAPSSSELWGREQTHSAEQQLALLGWTGVPVSDRPATRLPQTPEASALVARRLDAAGLAMVSFRPHHPAAASSRRCGPRRTSRASSSTSRRAVSRAGHRGPARRASSARCARDERAARHVDSPLAAGGDGAFGTRAALRRQRQRARGHRRRRLDAAGRRLRLVQRRPLAALDTSARRSRPRRDALRALPRLHLRRVRRARVHPPRPLRARVGGGRARIGKSRQT